MPKVISSQELDQIVELIGQYTDGIGVEGLVQAIDPGMPRRTLQRRLASLIEQKRIVSEGVGRGLRYRRAHRIVEVSITEHAHATDQIAAEIYIPISSEGEEIKAYVRQPRQQRKPVSYKNEFLEQYHPNQTTYLPESLRAQLHSLGRSPAEQSPAGTFARDILNRLLIDLSWASSKLEGNTYSRLDTERLIEFGQAAEGKDALETQMILNHKSAIEYLVRDTEHAGVNPETIIALHAFLSDGLMPDPLTCGRIRNRPVEIGGSVYLPIAMPQRLGELFGIVMSMAAEIRDPFEQSFFLMVHLPYLQPFEDVNKRTARLVANIPLIRENLKPLSFTEVDNGAYVSALLAVAMGADAVGFIFAPSTRQMQPVLPAIPQGKGKHAVEFVQTILSMPDEEMKKNLCIALGVKSDSSSFQFLSQFFEIEDLAIINDHIPPVRTVKWLMASFRKIDNG